MSDFDDDFETNRICPLCGAHAPSRRLEARGLFEFEQHDRCGHFLISNQAMSRIALESDEDRARRRKQVVAANERGSVPTVE